MLMNTRQVRDDIIEWDIANFGYCLDFWGKNIAFDKSKRVCLEIGARSGGLSLWMALKGYNVICTDLNKPSINAYALHEKYKVSDMIKYDAIDVTNIPYSNHFDIIMFKSVLGGVGRDNNKGLQMKAINEIYRALKPGGALLFAENCRGSALHQFLRRKFMNWGQSWRYITIEKMKEFLMPFSYFKYITVGFLGCLGRNEKQRMLLAKMDKIMFNNFIPERWKYIIIGVALK